MTDVLYTRVLDSDALDESSLVDEVQYNENTGDLFVDLGNEVYRYSNVPVSVVDDFENAESAGSFYNTVIKRKFGPGENLGSWTRLTYKSIEVEAKPQTVNISVSSNRNAPVSFNPGGVVTLSASESIVTPTAFSLKPFSDTTTSIEGPERDYAVVFTVSGLTGTKTHKLKSTTVDNAVKEVVDLGKMLELTFIPTQVIITL